MARDHLLQAATGERSTHVPPTSPNLTRWNMKRRDFEVFEFHERYTEKTPVHFHIGFYEVYLFLAGDVTYNVEYYQYQLVPGDLILIPPGVMHWPIISDQSLHYERQFLWINQQFLHTLGQGKEALDQCFNSEKYGYVFTLNQESFKDFRTIFGILQASESASYARELKGRSALTLLMLLINEICQNPDMHKRRTHWENADLWHITEYINTHIDSSNLSLDMLSSRYRVSKSSLSKAFLKQTGISLHQYIIKQRMKTAHQLLLTGVPPTEVYLRAGYTDYSSFYRVFTREFGFSPRVVAKGRFFSPGGG